MSILATTSRKVARPKNRQDQMMRQFRFARKSFEIEGIYLSDEVCRTFEDCIKSGCSPEQLHEQLQIHLAEYDNSLRK